MKFVIQRVLKSSVSVDGEVVGAIDRGYMVLVGLGQGDDESIADKMIDKMVKLRIFEDEEGKTNLSIDDVGGQILLVSQFTLYANCKKGNRPSFIDALDPAESERLYEYIVKKTSERIAVVEKGIFGADMKVEILNDGPFTVILDSDEIIKKNS